MSGTERSVAALLAEAAATLGQAGIGSPEVDAELLLASVQRRGRGEVRLAAITGGTVDPIEAEAFDALVAKRARRHPLQHLTGLAPFRSFELAVGPGVFVPRPETELVVQYAIDALRAVASPTPRAVDLGTGSGAIALAMALEVPHAEVTAVERSHLAYTWARRNIARLGPTNCRLVLGDLASALPGEEGTMDVVISNPPYVPTGMVPRDPEVRLFDPAEALYSGADGLDAVRALSVRAAALLRPGGLLVIEHGELQGEAIRSILTERGFLAARTERDLTGRDRATLALRDVPSAGDH